MIDTRDYPEIVEASKKSELLLKAWRTAYKKRDEIKEDTAIKFQASEDFDRNVYARVIYNTFYGSNPAVIKQVVKDVETNEGTTKVIEKFKKTFFEEFGDDFEKTSSKQRNDLVRMIAGGGGSVRFTEDVIWHDVPMVSYYNRNKRYKGIGIVSPNSNNIYLTEEEFVEYKQTGKLYSRADFNQNK